MRLKELYKNHKEIVWKSIKIWGGLAVFFLALNIIAYLGIVGLLITFFIVTISTFFILIFLDFRHSLKDESFALIFRNLNRIDKKFNSIKYSQYGIVEDRQNFVKLLWSKEDDNDLEISNLFTGKLHHNQFSFYNIDKGNRRGFLIECDNLIKTDVNQDYLLVNKNAPIDVTWLKQNKYRKIETTHYFNIYTNSNRKINDYFIEKVHSLVPYDEQQPYLLLIKDNTATLFVDELYPFHSSIENKHDADTFFIGEIENIKKQIEKLSIIMS